MGRLQTGRDRLGQNRRAYQALEQQRAQLNRTTRDGGLNTYRQALSLVWDQTRVLGSIDRRIPDTGPDIRKSNGAASPSGQPSWGVIGTTLLPPLNQVLRVLGSVINPVATLASTFPKVTTAVVGVTAGLVTLKLVTVLGAHAYTFFRGAVLSTMGVLILLRSGIIGTTIASGAIAVKTAVVTSAQWLWNTATTAGNALLGALRWPLVGATLPETIPALRPVTDLP